MPQKDRKLYLEYEIWRNEVYKLYKYLAINNFLLKTRNTIMEIDNSVNLSHLNTQINEISKEIEILKKIVYNSESEISGINYE